MPEQLREAWQNLKERPTLDELIQKAKLTTSVPSLSRKLRGEQVMTTEECQALADVIGVTLVWVPEDAA